MSQTVAEWLTRLGAQRDVTSWVAPYGRDWSRAFSECPRGDWLLALAARVSVDRPALVRAACACARLAGPYLGDHEPVAKEGLDAAEAWADRPSRPTEPLEEQAERLEAEGEGASDAAAASALLAAAAACHSARSPDAAASAASLAVEAAVRDAGECAMISALGFMQRKTADAVRTHVARELFRAPFD